jgi:hypothetical protein
MSSSYPTTHPDLFAQARKARQVDGAAGDPATREMVVAACRRAELSLSDRQIDMICAAAPYVMAMTRRLRRERNFREEPATIFQFPD